jgi:hypothetical protein
LASLLSIPLAEGYTPLTASPERQKQQILQALLTILRRIAAQQPVLFVMEDLHWRVERYALTGPLPPLAIPTTLHDSRMARLDRLAAVKGVAQRRGRRCWGGRSSSECQWRIRKRSRGGGATYLPSGDEVAYNAGS